MAKLAGFLLVNNADRISAVFINHCQTVTYSFWHGFCFIVFVGLGMGWWGGGRVGRCDRQKFCFRGWRGIENESTDLASVAVCTTRVGTE